MLRASLALLVLSLGADAWAACDATYGSDALLGHLVEVETAVRKDDSATARRVADAMEAGLGCLSEPLPYAIVARAYRAVGAGKVLGGDEARGKAWFLTALQLDPGFGYGLEDMSDESPVRGAFESQRDAAEIAPTALAGRTFLTGSTYYLDGSLLGAPRATLGRPHVFQIKTDAGVTSALIEGNVFPETALVAPVVAEVVPPEPTRTPKPKPVRPEPVAPETVAEANVSHRRYSPRNHPMVDENGFSIPPRPAEKTPLIIAGAATVAGATGLYVGASFSRKKFDDAASADDVAKYRTLTNNLVVASAAVLAVGAGVLTWGIIVDDTGRPLPGIHIKF